MIPKSFFPSERIYEATVVANDQYISYTQTFEISVEFPANFDFTVSPQAPVANDRTTGKRTFVLALTLLEIKATSPMFVVDWGDGSDIAPAAPLLLSSAAFSWSLSDQSVPVTCRAAPPVPPPRALT